GALRHRPVLEQGRLDLERPDAVRGRRDHVVSSPGEPEVAVLVTRRAVAGHVPVAAEDGRGLVRCAVVLDEQARGAATQGDVTLLADGDLVSLVVNHGEVVSRRGEAHRAGP